ncbi:unnamed protein product [Clonostachys byssicola]|uniref:F-box domain-containing protein n=1 Tax=Clonostachys byssicola TaxID=160290 RepID=A0A9N9Y882_9HYPO|nr:unnamed protein product [Clonostachys byssicola]
MAHAQLKSTALLTLPPEIQTKIFSNLTVSFGTSNIQGVLRTCKQLYEVALPLSVSIFRNTVRHPRGQGPCSRTRNAQFLRYILISKPWLAAHVKTVILGRVSEDGEGADSGNLPQDVTESELSVYHRHIKFILGQLPSEFNDRWCARWVEDLRKGTSSDAQAALILLTCPNIQTILFEKPSTSCHFLRLLQLVHNLRDIQESIYSPGSDWTASPRMVIPLSNVQDVFHETIDWKGGYTTFSVEGSSIFRFPQIKSYECILAYGHQEAAENFRALPPRSSSIEEITLRSCHSSAAMLQSMLGACRALKKLEISHFQIHSEDASVTFMMPRDILDAILPHANTLQHLYLNLEEEFDKQWNWRACPERLYMGPGLRQMHKLKRLTLGMQALTGMLPSQPESRSDDSYDCPMPLEIEGSARIIDCLPEGLEYLKISECGVMILEQVAELLNIVEQGHRFKRLAYVGLLFSGWLMQEADDLNAFEALRCNATKVRLDMAIQSHNAFYHDLGEGIPEVLKTTRFLHEGDAEELADRVGYRNTMSRIYAPHCRQFNLRSRGTSDYQAVWCTWKDDPDTFVE